MYPEEIVRNRPEVLTELKIKLLETGVRFLCIRA